MSICLCEPRTRAGCLVVGCACDMSHLLCVTRITSTMTVGGSGVCTASGSLVYGSAGAPRYLVAGIAPDYVLPQSFSLTPTAIGTTSFTWKYGWPASSGSSDRRCTRGKLQSAVLRDHARGVSPSVVGDRLIHDCVDIFRQQKPLGDELFGGRAHCRGIVLARRIPFGSRRPSRWEWQLAAEALVKHIRQAVNVSSGIPARVGGKRCSDRGQSYAG